MKNRTFRNDSLPVLAALTLFAFAAAARAAAPEDELALLRQSSRAFSRVAEKALPGMVFIQVEKTIETGTGTGNRYFYNDPQNFFGDEFMRRFFGYDNAPRRRFKQQGQGSGFLISEDGYILTNNHVVGDADKIRVKLNDGREFEAQRIGSDPKSEVAVIKIDAKDLPFIALGDSSDLRIGEWVIAIGNPFGLAETLTVGVVSAKGRTNIGIADYEDFIQTDAAINPGNSGGPLLNIEGEVVGINTAIYSQSGGYMGIGFAIPINMAKTIKEQLVRTGKVVRGYLGVAIQDFTKDLADSFGQEPGGILISGVEKDSPADQAGLKQEDVITKLNGQPVTSVSEFRNRVSSNVPGSKLTLTVLRDGKEKTIEAETGAMPGTEESESVTPEVYEELGMTVETLSPDVAERLGYDLNTGVVVTQVEADGLAAQVGIRPGHLVTSVNRQPVTTPAEFKKALSESRASGSVLLRVTDGRVSRFVVLSLQ